MNNPNTDRDMGLDSNIGLNPTDIRLQIDTIGLSCPLPLLKMKQLLRQAKIGETVFVKASDSASERDFKSFIATTSHKLVCEQNKGVFLYWITKMD